MLSEPGQQCGNMPEMVFDKIYNMYISHFRAKKDAFYYFEYLFWFTYNNKRSLLSEEWIDTYSKNIIIEQESDMFYTNDIDTYIDLIKKRLVLDDDEFEEYTH